MRIVVVGSAVVLAACGSSPKAAEDTRQAVAAEPGEPITGPTAGVPDVADCPAREPVEDGLRPRTVAIPVPALLGETMRSDVDNIAVSTLDGATICVDASWMNSLENPALSPDKRFASFDWQGYEAFGHIIVDRRGKGSVLDTGVQPVASPSGRLLAAADLSESAYGALNGFAIWRIEQAGFRQLAKQEVVPPVYDWRIEGWANEACVDLSAVRLDDPSDDVTDPREPYRARQSGGWQLEPGRCADG
jgi:hypothetical protein